MIRLAHFVPNSRCAREAKKLDTTAVIFERDSTLLVDELTLVEPGPADTVVDVHWSGVSAGTERLLWSGEMPWFPGLNYPLVPGYEAVGEIVDAGTESGFRVGERVFVPGANCYRDASGLFGAAASQVVVPGDRLVRVDPAVGGDAVLLSLAATAHHALAGSPHVGPALIVGHGTLGRLMARIAIADGRPAPKVWDAVPERMAGARGYEVATAEDDTRTDYATVFDASGDGQMLDRLIARLCREGEVVLAGFYAKPLSFAFPPAFMREASFRVAAEWQPRDLERVLALIADGLLDLSGLVSHRARYEDAEAAYRTAFNDPTCLKMVLDWRSKQ
jgi:3-hydroxyethyl bacteriochlorophyllide a dehydrogenase